MYNRQCTLPSQRHADGPVLLHLREIILGTEKMPDKNLSSSLKLTEVSVFM